MLNHRMSEILTYIIKNEYIKIEDLSEKLNISQRTIYYDISNINKYLEDNKLKKIQNSRSLGFYINDLDKIKIKKAFNISYEENYIHSSQERSIITLLDLLKSEGVKTIKYYEELLQVSRNTILKDFRNIKELVNKYNIELETKKGYRLIGCEYSKKSLFSYIFNNYSYLLSNIHELESIIDIIGYREDYLYVKEYIEQYYYNYYDKKDANKENYNNVKDYFLKENQELIKGKDILKIIKNEYKIEIDDNEKYFISMFLLSDDFIKTKFKEIESNRYKLYKVKILSMIREFEISSCLEIENKEKLSVSILDHLVTCIVRSRVGIYLPNILKKEIKERYFGIYIFTKNAIEKELNSIDNLIFNDDIITYITMYFGGIIHNSNQYKKVPSIIIVCNEGKATSELLRIQIEELFTRVDIVGVISVKDVKEITYEYDFIVTTIDIYNDYKVIKVNPILTDIDKSNLLFKISNVQVNYKSKDYIVNQIISTIDENATIHNSNKLRKEIDTIICNINNENKEYTPELKDLIQYDTVQILRGKYSWKDAIKESANPLISLGNINNDYVEAMINNIKKLGPYIVITDKVAIPHAAPQNGVKKLGVSITIFKEGVEFSEIKKAHIFIVIAPIDKKSHLSIILSINNLLKRDDKIEQLLNANTKNEILRSLST
ncbi:BglG family transcription antiterminator [Clostridioides difficile]|nr:BglG family transcription antiterminator [Clostridioides difficile]